MRPIRSKEETVKALLDGTFERELDAFAVKVHSTFNRLIEQRKTRWANRSMSDRFFDWMTGNTL